MFTVYNEHLHRHQSLKDISFDDYINFDYRIAEMLLNAYATEHNLPINDDTRKQMILSFCENAN